jgi:hypothetical protein
MFEHKHLDDKWNRVVPATDSFLSGDILECRDSVGKEPETVSRRQYGVVGDRLVERCLPPQAIGDAWSYDSAGLPWWGAVNNPPHMGIVAEFNTHNGGLHRKPLDLAHNVVAFASAGEEITFADGIYTVTRQSDAAELKAPSILELRKLYFA